MADAEKAVQGLQDAFAQIDQNSDIAGGLKQFGEELQKTLKLYKDGKVPLEAMIETTRVVSKNLHDLSVMTPEMIVRLSDLSVELAKEKNKAQEFGSALDKASSGLSALGKIGEAATGDALLTSTLSAVSGVMKKFGVELAAVDGGLAVLAAPLGALAGVVGVIAAGLGVMVVATDSAAKAQRAEVESLLQTGIGADKLRWGMGSTVDQVLKAGAQFGYTQEEVGGLSKAFSEAGIAVRKTGDRLSQGDAIQASYTEAVRLSASMAKSFGSDLGETGGIVSMLGTQFNIAGKNMEPAVGTYLKAQADSGLQFSAFTRVSKTVYDSVRSLGSGFDEATGIASKWSKEIQRGTISAQELSSVYDSQSGSFEKQMQNMMMVRNFDKAGAAAIGINGNDQFENLYKFQKAQETVAGQGMIAQSYANLAKQGGGSQEHQIEVFKNLMETQLGFKTTLENVEKMFNNPKTFSDIKASDKGQTPEERVAQMFRDAEKSVEKFGTSGENLNKSVITLTSSINGLRDKIPDFSHGMIADAGTIAGAAKHPVDTMKDVLEHMVTFKAASSTYNEQYNAGLVDTKNSRLRQAQRQGGGAAGAGGDAGVVHITMGDTQVVVQGHDKAALAKALDEHHEKSKADILNHVDDQWRRAQFAQ